MSTKKLYRIYCVTESKQVSGFTCEDVPPTLCPNNPEHEVREDSKVILETISVDNLEAVNPPNVDEDITQGYEVDSKWVDTTTNEEYVCVDNTAGAAIWNLVGIYGSFGKSYTYGKSLDENSTDGEEWIKKLTLTTDDLDAGLFRASWSFLRGASSTSAHLEVRITIDDTTILHQGLYESKDKNVRAVVSGFDVLNLDEGSHKIDFEFRKEPSNGTVIVSKVIVDLWKVG